jgi:hypothetical protein
MVLVLSAGLQLAKKLAMIQANERRYMLDGKKKGGGRE